MFLFARVGAQAATDVEIRAFPWRCPRKLAPVLVFLGNRWQLFGIGCESSNFYMCLLLGAGAWKCVLLATVGNRCRKYNFYIAFVGNRCIFHENENLPFS